jgi:hypothetical protein
VSQAVLAKHNGVDGGREKVGVSQVVLAGQSGALT